MSMKIVKEIYRRFAKSDLEVLSFFVRD